MKHQIAKTLDQLGLYGKYKNTSKMVRNPALVRYAWDVQRDYWLTQRQISYLKDNGLNHVDPNRQVLIISRTNLPFLIKSHALLAKAVQLQGYSPIILTTSGNHFAQKYLKLFGLKNIVFWDKYSQGYDSCLELAKQAVGSFLTDKPNIQNIKQWQFNGVYVGKHGLSTAIRAALQGQFDLTNPEHFHLFKKHLVEAVNSVLVAENLLNERMIVKMIVRDSGYTPNGPIYEVGLNRGVDAIRLEMAQMKGHWMIKRYNLNTRGRALFSLSPDTWGQLQNIPLTMEQEQALDANFQERYNPSSNIDMYKYQLGKQDLPPEEVRRQLSLDPHKKTAVIFSHISWDANFFDGEDLYNDFEHWLVETVRVACENPNLNWVVKLHPANVHKLAREQGEIAEETEMAALRRLGELPDHIKILHADTEINTASLFSVIDYGLTVRGTIGMELPCFGIPVLTAGTGKYDGYGFTIDPANRAEYEDYLRHLHLIHPLTEAQIQLARRHAYWLFIRQQISFEDIMSMSSTLLDDPNHPLRHNALIKASTIGELQNSPSLTTFTDWFLHSKEPDLIV